MLSKVLFWSLGMFGFSMFLHVFIWRIFKPKAYLWWLSVNFYIIPILIFLTFFLKMIPQSCIIPLIFAHYVFSTAYILIFPAFVHYSPSFEILKTIKEKKLKGATLKSFNKAVFNENNMIMYRLKNLNSTGFTTLRHKKFIILSQKAKIILTIIRFYRNLLNIPSLSGG